MAKRERQGAQFEEAYEARDIDQAIKGGYPQELVNASVVGNTITIFTCPSGVWRVLLTLWTLNTQGGARMAFSITRNGVRYRINGYAVYVTMPVSIPFVMVPGDILSCVDEAAQAGTITCSIGYIDVPIPGGGEPCFKPGRRG